MVGNANYVVKFFGKLWFHFEEVNLHISLWSAMQIWWFSGGYRGGVPPWGLQGAEPPVRLRIWEAVDVCISLNNINGHLK